MQSRAAALGLVVLLGGASLAGAGCGDDRPSVEIDQPGGTGTGSGEPSGSAASGTDGGLADCGEILKAYASLAATAVKGKDAAAAAEKTLEGLKSKLPSDLQDDLAVVADAFGAIADKGVVDGSAALRSSAFVEASENIVGYLRDDCLPG